MSAARRALHERRDHLPCLSLKVRPPPGTHRVAAGRFAKLETRSYSWIMRSRVLSFVARKKRKRGREVVKEGKGASICVARFVGQGSARGDEGRGGDKRKAQTEPAGRVQDRCYLDCTRRHYFVIGFIRNARREPHSPVRESESSRRRE